MTAKYNFPNLPEDVSIHHSFSARLSLYIVLAASVIFLVLSLVFFLGSGRIVKQEAVHHANSELAGTVH